MTCSVSSCNLMKQSRGMCSKHYRRWVKEGIDNIPRKIATTEELQDFAHNAIMTTNKIDCILWPFAKDGNGYGAITIDGKQIRVIRYICEEFHGPPEERHLCCHSCDTLSCINPHHLRWGTHADNKQDEFKEKQI